MPSISNGESGSSVRTKLNTLLGGVQYVAMTITSAQLLNAATVPIEVIAAPGAGKRIYIFATSFSIGGTTNYTVNGDSVLNYGAYGTGTAIAAYVFTNSNLNAGRVGGSTQRLVGSNGQEKDFLKADIENKAVNYSAGTADLTGGDGDMKITVFYAVVDV